MADNNDQLALGLLSLSDVRPPSAPAQPTASSLESTRTKIFANRSISFDRFRAVAFDLLFVCLRVNPSGLAKVLASQMVPQLDRLGWKLTENEFSLRCDFAQRGLLLDKRHALLLSVDEARNVRRAYRGHLRLPRDERQKIFRGRVVQEQSKRFFFAGSSIDRFVCDLYASVVEARSDLRDLNGEKLFDDIAGCLAQVLQSDAFVDALIAEPNLWRAQEQDNDFEKLAKHFAEAGKKIFVVSDLPEASAKKLITLLSESAGLGELISLPSLQTAALIEATRKRAVQASDLLWVTDLLPIPPETASELVEPSRLLILPELFQEFTAQSLSLEAEAQTRSMQALSTELSEDLRHQQWLARQLENQSSVPGKAGIDGPSATKLAIELLEIQRKVARLTPKVEEIDDELDGLHDRWERVFHPFWGSLFRIRFDLSLFGDCLRTQTDLYTADAMNLLAYSPVHSFRGPVLKLPHES